MYLPRQFSRCVLGAALFGVISYSVLIAAQSPEEQKKNQEQQNKQQEQQKKQQEQQMSSQQTQAQGKLQVVRTSKLIGKDIKNSEGKNLGNVHDLVLTPDYQRVSYIALSRGGFWGIGDDLYAVPWSALRQSAGDEYILDISEQQLESTDGFDQDRWPSQPSRQFQSAAQKSISDLTRRRTPGTMRQSDTDRESTTGQSGTATRRQTTEGISQSDTDRQSAAERRSAATQRDTRGSRRENIGSQPYQLDEDWDSDDLMATDNKSIQQRRVSKLIGMNVKNYQDQDVGNIEDFVVSAQGLSHGASMLSTSSPRSSSARSSTDRTERATSESAAEKRQADPQQSETSRRQQQAQQSETSRRQQQSQQYTTRQQQDDLRQQQSQLQQYETSASAMAQSGHILYAVISVGGFMGFDEEYALVPSNVVSLRTQRDYVLLNADQEELRRVAFDPENWPDLSDRSYARRVYEGFGEEPHWIILGFVAPVEETDSSKAWSPQSDYCRNFDPSKAKTIKGTVESIGTFEPAAGVREGLRLRIRTDDGKRITVHAGPQWHAQQQDFAVMPGDQITVTGSDFAMNQRQIFMASKLQSGSKSLDILSKTGETQWKEKQQMKDENKDENKDDKKNESQPQSQTQRRTGGAY